MTEQTATDPAKSFTKSIAGTYKTTANLYMRNGAGQGKAAMVVLPKGTSVKNYGYYTSASGVKWPGSGRRLVKQTNSRCHLHGDSGNLFDEAEGEMMRRTREAE